MLVSIKNCSNNYYRACIYAYLADYSNFIKYFGLINIEEDELISFYIIRGIRFSLSFAQKIDELSKSDICFNKLIFSSISARYIMSNCCLDSSILKNFVPVNFWYPNTPTKETCFKLLEINNNYKYPIAVLSIINNWTDVFNLCNIDKAEDSIYNTAKFFNRCLDNFPEINKNDNYCYFDEDTYESGLHKIENIYIKPRHSINKFLFPSFQYTYQYDDENYLVKSEEDISEYTDYFTSDNIGFADICSLGMHLIKSEKFLEAKNLNKHNVRYNLINSIYVINNKYNYELCRYAVTNYLINYVYDKDLVNTYSPFYIYSYKLPNLDIIEKVISNHPNLKYNASLALAIMNNCNYFNKYDIKPDVDLLNYAKRSGSIDFYNKLYNKGLELGVFYKHLDFENLTNYNIPLEIKLTDINKYIKENEGHPLLITNPDYFI